MTKKQLALITDLFSSGLAEAEVLKKHKVTIKNYRRWLEDPDFKDEIQFRIDSARRQSQLIIANFAPTAAAQLVRLTASEKEETSRKACLDIISLPLTNTGDSENPQAEDETLLSAETAGKLLALLAKETS